MSGQQYPLAAAVHEAAHAVARAYVGAPLVGLEIRQDGNGLCLGTEQQWVCDYEGQYSAWALIAVLLAGGIAEARATRKNTSVVLMLGASDDCRAARACMDWLVSQSYARSTEEAWSRGIREAKDIVAHCWTQIVKVAESLRCTGKLTALEIEQLLNGPPSV